jgi:cytosine/adenosine deaminase-related metal-dependent hydrolase
MKLNAILWSLFFTGSILPAATVESGAFRLHKLLQPIGEESYEIARDGDRLKIRVKFEFVDRGSKVALTAAIDSTPEYVPVKFEIKGNTSRMSRIDAGVEITDGQATVREGKSSRVVAVPEHYAMLAGYAPASAQMLMLRHWMQSGRPSSMAILPSGHVEIEARGQDSVDIGGKPTVLNRFSINGIIWGQETLWTDTSGTLVALVGVDAEFDHFEAVREGYEPALATFVRRAAESSMKNLAALAGNQPQARREQIAITGATLISGTGDEPVPDAVIVIDGDRIAAAGPRSKVKIPRNAVRIDATGKTVLPGLWDMHAHFEQVEWGPVYLAAGVTTARDNGNEFEFITAARDAIRDGRGVGPRLLLAGIVDGDGKSALGVVRANTPEEAKAVVDRYHRAGFEQIKIYSSVQPEILKDLAAEAHRSGMTVTGHVPNGMTMFEAIESGMDMISHMYPQVYLSAFPKGVKRFPGMMPALKPDAPEFATAIAFLKEHGTVLDPTMTVYELMWHSVDQPDFEPGIRKVAPELAASLRETGVPKLVAGMVKPGFDGGLAFVAAAHKAGVPIVAGTDQTVPGFSIYREIELYVQAGMTPVEAIQAATIVPARAMKLDKESGTIENGKRADLIIVNGNPLKSIREIRNVERVFTGGRIYDPAVLWKSIGFQP